MRDYIIHHSQYNLVLEGMQSKENYFVPPDQSIHDIPNNVENLHFCGYGNEENMTELNLSFFGFTQLRSIAIGNDCFKNVRKFVLDGLEKLESVKIGEKSFSISDNKRNDGLCRITNCPNLRQLVIGYYSFRDFKQFELSNVKSLQSIQFGEYCFKYAMNCILKGE